MRTWNFPAYLQLGAMQLKMAYMYRANIAITLLSVLLKVYLLKLVFVAVYAGRSSVDGVALQQVITFVTLANLQGFLLSTMIPDYVRQRIREGQVAHDLARPMSFLNQLWGQQFGATVAVMPFVLLGLPFAILLGGLQLPASTVAGLLYVLSLGLGYLIAMLLGLIIALIGFWTLELSGIFTIYSFANQFFGGALVPLWFFPPLLRRLADVLPFQAQAFIPLSLYLGQAVGIDAGRAIALQCFWVVALAGVAATMWRRAVRRVVVQGG